MPSYIPPSTRAVSLVVSFLPICDLGPTGSQMGKKETTKDTARVLGGMYDGIEYRGFIFIS
jgi:ornithine carbamoyltransferase